MSQTTCCTNSYEGDFTLAQSRSCVRLPLQQCTEAPSGTQLVKQP